MLLSPGQSPGGAPFGVANSYGGQRLRDLSAEHAAEERRLQEILQRRLCLVFDHFYENAMARFGHGPRMITREDLHNIIHQSFSEEMARIVPGNSPPVQVPSPNGGSPQYRLEFTHVCKAQSCEDHSCTLCKNNPKRPCGPVIFKRKYFENDILTAKCGGSIMLQLVDANTSELVKVNTTLELFILKGTSYDNNFKNGIPHCGFDGVANCSLLTIEQEEKDDGKKIVSIPLLQSDYLENHHSGKLFIHLQDGEANLPNLKVIKSSEALLRGRRTSFRLYVGVIGDAALALESVAPAVDPRGFVVATQRAKLQDKKERPFLDDPIASLEQIGGRRVETLGCLEQKKLFKDLPYGTPGKVSTVRDFLKLGELIIGHPQQKKELLTLLKMNEMQWIDAWDHAETAVEGDNRLRVWWANEMEGLLYECETGEIKLKCPVGLIQISNTPHALICKDLPQEQQKYVNNLHSKAEKKYHEWGHPGWDIYPFDSGDFKKDPTHMSVQGPNKYQGQVAKMELLDEGIRVGESDNVTSGISNMTLGDGSGCSSGLFRSLCKDEMSLQSFEMNDVDFNGALAGDSLGHPELEHQNVAFPGPQVDRRADATPPARIPVPPPDSGFTHPPMQGSSHIMPQTHIPHHPSTCDACHLPNAPPMTMRHQPEHPIVFANPAPVKVMPGGGENGEGLTNLGAMPSCVTGHGPDMMVQAAQQFGIEQPFQDIGGEYISVEDLGSWKSVVSPGDQDF